MDEENERYKTHKDFTSLNAWKKCQEVKLFFYQEVINQLPNKKNSI